MGGIEAAVVAREMLYKIQEWKEQGKTDSEIVALAVERLEQIERAGKSGWY